MLSLNWKVWLVLIISIIANIGQLVLMFKILFWKRQKNISDFNKKIIKREEVEEKIKEKYKGKEEKLNEDIKKAKNFSDYINIFADK